MSEKGPAGKTPSPEQGMEVEERKRLRRAGPRLDAYDVNGASESARIESTRHAGTAR